MARPRPVPSSRPPSENASNSFSRTWSGNAGTGIGDLHDRIVRVAPRADPHRSTPILASQCLHRVLGQVADGPIELVTIGDDRERQWHLVAPVDRAVIDGERRLHLIDQRRQGERRAPGRRQPARRKAQRVRAERDGPIDRGDQRQRQLLHFRIARHRQPIGQDGGGRQHVAEIVVDLGDAGADGGEPRTLTERPAHTPLHDLQLPLGQADLVAPAAHLDGGGGVLRRAAERDQAVGHAAERQHHEPVQREIDQARDDERQNDREPQNAPRVVEHRREHRGFRQHDVHHRVGGIAGRGCPSPGSCARRHSARHRPHRQSGSSASPRANRRSRRSSPACRR